MRLLLASLFALLAVSVAPTCRDETAKPPPKGVYISLGDSVAAGNGASDPATTSWVALLAKYEGGIETMNLAVAGATTDDVIAKQLRAALEAIGSGRVAFITISAGGNDFAGLIPNQTCVQDPIPASCPIDATLQRVQTNLDVILGRLRDEEKTAPIVLLAYPNFFSGTGHAFEQPAARVLPRLDDVIRGVASRYKRTATAEPWDAFQGNGGTLTHVLDPAGFDPHPNDAGHRAIADAFIAALEAVK